MEMQHDYLEKARESLQGAESELANRRYNNAANRVYYACFHAAIAALLDAGIRDERWEHDFVQSRFSGILIRQRKLYPSLLGHYLPDNFDVRREGDYKPAAVSSKRAREAIERAQEFVRLIARQVEREK